MKSIIVHWYPVYKGEGTIIDHHEVEIKVGTETLILRESEAGALLNELYNTLYSKERRSCYDK